MKKAFLFISTAFLLSSCAAVKSPVTGYVYQETQSPVSVTSNPLGSKKGEATATSVLGWFAFGDASVQKAAKDGGITRVQEAKEEGIRQGIWLCIQRLVHMEQYDMAKYFIKLFGFDRNECEMLLDKNGSDDKMESFIIQMVFNKDDKIILDDIGYHKIGSIFKYNIDSKEVELEVVESSDASCEGCAFNNSKNYYCKDTHCIDVDRKDDIDVIYKKVKRS